VPLHPSNISRPADAACHDTPLTHVGDDDYDRWPVASAIDDALLSAPETWSTRIGVFGRWGEGKTSVLRLLEQELAEQGVVVVWFSAWATGTDSDFWPQFSRTLVAGFEQAGLPLTMTSRLRAFASQNLLTFLRGCAAAVQLKGVTVPDTLVTETHTLFERHLRLGKSAIARMLATARAKRVLVLLDDLDRAADIARFVPVEKMIGFRCIRIFSVVAIEKMKRHEDIEEVARASFGDTQLRRQLRSVERAIRESREHPNSTALNDDFDSGS